MATPLNNLPQSSDASTSQNLDVTLAGTYSVTVTDASGCTAQDSMLVDMLNADIAQNDTTICEGDSLVLLIENKNYYSEDFEGIISNEWNNTNTFNFNTSFDNNCILCKRYLFVLCKSYNDWGR